MSEINLTQILLTIIGFLIVHVLNGIKAEIKEVKSTVKNLEENLQTGITDLEVRLSVVEAQCKLGVNCGIKNSN